MTEESGWLIEEGNSETSRPKYWCGFLFGMNPSGSTIKAIIHKWSFDNLAAIRFARRDDALKVRQDIESNDPEQRTHRVAEHGWG